MLAQTADTARKKQRRYSPSFISNVLAKLALNGGNITETAKNEQVPVGTLFNWSHGRHLTDEIIANVNVKKAAIIEQLSDLRQDAIGALTPTKMEASSAQQLAVIIGTLTDKIGYLESESALTREEAETYKQQLFQAVTAIISDHDTLDKIADEFKRIRAGVAGGTTPDPS